MNFMDLLDEYIDLKIEGEPTANEWRSISENSDARTQYHSRLGFLREEIDAVVSKAGASDKGETE
jgi:hypothetical protein